MPTELSPAQINRLLVSVGRKGDADLTAAIPDLATECLEDKPLAATSTKLLLLYVRLELIDLIAGGTWSDVTYKEGDESENLSDRTKNLSVLRGNTETEIAKQEAEIKEGMAGLGVACGQIIAQATVENCYPNPNDRAFSGDPLRGRGWF